LGEKEKVVHLLSHWRRAAAGYEYFAELSCSNRICMSFLLA
jgi:hypothetical protein